MREWITQMRLRLSALLLRKKFDRDLEDELSFHLAMRGDTPEGRRRFGNATLVKERTRELWTFAPLEFLAQDLRYAARLLRRSPVFAIAAILSLALGIGATTALFSLMDALVWRTLPVPQPERLVEFGTPSYSYPAYEFFRDRNQSFSGIFATDGPQPVNVTVESSDQERTQVELATGSYFSTLGVAAILGRTFTSDDDRTPGEHPVVVLSHAYWERRFRSDPDVTGKTIRIHRFPFTVIGVGPAGFSGVKIGAATDMWTPMMMQPQVMPGRDWIHRQSDGITTWLHVFGRLKPGIGIDDALPAVRALVVQEQIEAAGGTLSPDQLRGLERSPFQLIPATRGMSPLRRTYRFPLQFLMAATGLVLLIACANLANLLLARAGARRREIGVRLALGASRGRLIRQMMTESALLSFCGGALGLLIAQWGTALLLRIISTGSDPVSLAIAPDWRLLGFTAAACGITAVLFGLWPALRTTRVDVSPSLKQGAALSGREQLRANRVFTLVQVSLSVLLLCGAGIFLRNLGNLRNINLGIRTEQLIQLDVDPLTAGYKGASFQQLCQRLLDRMAILPGVQSATLSENGVFSGRESNGDFDVPGFTPQRKQDRVAYLDVVAPKYFSTLGIGLLAGRDFLPGDTETAPKAMLVNDTLARFFFPKGDILRRKVNYNGAVWEIIGVVHDARDHSVRQAARRRFYMVFPQVPRELTSVRFLVRTSAPPDSLATLLRQTVRSEDPLLPVLSAHSVPVLIDRQLAVDRMLATLAGYFAVLALLVAAIGLHGTLSYQIVRRTKEIGIRVALGAARRQIVWSVTAESLGLVLAGVLFGVAGTFALSRSIETLLFEIRPTDPFPIAAAVGVLAIGAIPAALVPALRAARADPARTLREE